MMMPSLRVANSQPFSWEMDVQQAYNLVPAQGAWIGSYHEAGHFLAAKNRQQPIANLKIRLEDRSAMVFSWRLDFRSTGDFDTDIEIAAGGGASERLLRRQFPLRSDPRDAMDEVFAHTHYDRVWARTEWEISGADDREGFFWKRIESISTAWEASAKDIQWIDCIAEQIYEQWRLHDFVAEAELTIIGSRIAANC